MKTTRKRRAEVKNRAVRLWRRNTCGRRLQLFEQGAPSPTRSSRRINGQRTSSPATIRIASRSNGIVDKAPKDAPIGFVHNRGMDDDGFNIPGIEDTAQMRHHPSERRKRMKWCLFPGDVVAGRAVQPAAPGIDESWWLWSRG